MSVLRDWSGSEHARASQQMHRAACGIFTTKLGPASGGMHEGLFHCDLARRHSGPICR